jgi:hypothetical protein
VQLKLVESTQAPNKHFVEPLHTVPQAPQFDAFDVRSTQEVPQAVCPVGHTHALLTHVAVLGQTLLQAPQLLTSADTLS